MDGITILGNYSDKTQGAVTALFFVLILCLAIALIAFVCDSFWCGVLFTIMGIVFLLGVSIESEKMDRIKVMIDDSVSFNEFMENYDVVDQDGLIWTVKIKDNPDK